MATMDAMVIMKDQKYATIPVLKETKQRLMKHGNKGESFDKLINRILDEAVKEEKKKND